MGRGDLQTMIPRSNALGALGRGGLKQKMMRELCINLGRKMFR